MNLQNTKTTRTKNIKKNTKNINKENMKQNKNESKSSESFEQTNMTELNEYQKINTKIQLEKKENVLVNIEDNESNERQNRFLGKKRNNTINELDKNKELKNDIPKKKNKLPTYIYISDSDDTDKIKENSQKLDRTIYVKIYNQEIKEYDLNEIFQEYGTISNISKKSKYSGLIEFNDKNVVDKIMSNKNKIKYKGRNMQIKHSYTEIPEKINIKTIENEKEKSDNEYIIEGKEVVKDKYVDIKISEKKENNNESRIDELEKKINKINKLYEEQQLEIKKLKLSINIMASINNQKDIYYQNNFNYLNQNLRAVLNSYKILFIRKLANIILKEIYEKYSKNLGKGKVPVGSNNHNIIAFYGKTKILNRFERDQLNLLIDFLRFVWDKCSTIIHVDDKDFPLQKEIFFEYLKPLKYTSNKNVKDKIEINELVEILFESKDNGDNKIRVKDNDLCNAIKNIFKGTKHDENKIKDNLIIQLSDTDEEKENDKLEFDENEIKDIINNNLKEYDIDKELSKLIQLIKKNKEGKNSIIDSNKEINGEYFYNLWVGTFGVQHYKDKKLYKKYFKVGEIKSLKEMGEFVCKLLQGMKINIFTKDPKGVDKVIKNELP